MLAPTRISYCGPITLSVGCKIFSTSAVAISTLQIIAEPRVSTYGAERLPTVLIIRVGVFRMNTLSLSKLQESLVCEHNVLYNSIFEVLYFPSTLHATLCAAFRITVIESKGNENHSCTDQKFGGKACRSEAPPTTSLSCQAGSQQRLLIELPMFKHQRASESVCQYSKNSHGSRGQSQLSPNPRRAIDGTSLSTLDEWTVISPCTNK
ncbi:hypothetical protein J6590_059792 [Homalodisca vitripennis]|nr:hypothetical protein J6590_059792 [Homalodisca vitripennis]